jgi:hypothetical protein
MKLDDEVRFPFLKRAVELDPNFALPARLSEQFTATWEKASFLRRNWKKPSS